MSKIFTAVAAVTAAAGIALTVALAGPAQAETPAKPTNQMTSQTRYGYVTPPQDADTRYGYEDDAPRRTRYGF